MDLRAIVLERSDQVGGVTALSMGVALKYFQDKIGLKMAVKRLRQNRNPADVDRRDERRQVMSEANKQVALDFLAAMDAGEAEAMARCVTEDCFVNTQGFAGVSGRRNRETMLATASAFKQIVPTGFRPKIKRVVADEQTAVLEFEGDAVLSNGELYCNQYVFVFYFENGKIKQLNEYFCTVLADKVMLPLLLQQGEEIAHGN